MRPVYFIWVLVWSVMAGASLTAVLLIPALRHQSAWWITVAVLASAGAAVPISMNIAEAMEEEPGKPS